MEIGKTSNQISGKLPDWRVTLQSKNGPSKIFVMPTGRS
jgi:hypothetical protein